MKTLLIIFATGIFSLALAREKWTPAEAQAWYERQPWLVGCNFIPSTAVNELEMWQAGSFDPDTIDRELGYAEGIGFTSVRVFLHNIPYEQDKEGFLKRIDQFLGLCQKHKIGVMFVMLDSCWDPFPAAGKQLDPVPFRHNSGWAQAPGKAILMDPTRHDSLKPYITDVISRYKDDPRVQVWDLFNEPDNPNPDSYWKYEDEKKPELALQLLKKVFVWARDANPTQPLTSAPWNIKWDDQKRLTAVEHLQLDESDIITFHNYGNQEDLKKWVEHLRPYQRPILCTEYLARPRGSTFAPHLGYMKDARVGAYNWGFVAGKTNTIYPWDSWQNRYTAEPSNWFHDIFRRDGTPYDATEVKYIKTLTGR